MTPLDLITWAGAIALAVIFGALVVGTIAEVARRIKNGGKS